MSFFDALKNATLDALLGDGTTLLAGTVDMGLSLTPPADDGTNINEPAGGSYSRVTITNNSTNWPNAASGEKANGAPISFATASADWGTITHWVLYSGGSPKIWGILDNGAETPAPRAVYENDTMGFPTGALRVTLD